MFNIIVCAKQVPDTNEIRINPETGTLIRDGVPSILNPDDANALEEALKIKDMDPENVHVTVVSMGPMQAQDMLFECLAMGADEGVLLSDRAVGGSDTWVLFPRQIHMWNAFHSVRNPFCGYSVPEL